MAVTLTGTGGYFTRLGLLGGGVNQVNTFRGTTVGTTRVNNLRAQFNSADQALVDSLYQQGVNYQSVHSSWLSYLAQLSAAVLIQMAQDSSPLATGQLPEALNVLIAQMKGSSDSIKANVVSVSVSTGSANTGDGVVAASVVASDGGKLENSFAETMKATVTADSYSGGAVAGSEPLTVLGITGPTDPLNWNFAVAGYGSNAQTSIGAIDATAGPSSSGNLLNNSDYEDWGSVSANLPNQWDLVTGTAGTDVLKSSSPYDGSYALEFLGDGATLSGVQQKFNSTAGNSSVLKPRQVLAVCLRTKIGASAPAAGSLRVSLVDGAGTVINNDAGTTNQFNIDLTASTTSYAAGTGFFQLPSILPTTGVYLRIKLSTAITNAKFVVIDHVACAVARQMYNSFPTDNIAGGPYVCCFSGVTNFVVNDTFSITVANDYGGLFQTYIWKAYNTPQLGVRVPSITGGAQTINDGLLV